MKRLACLVIVAASALPCAASGPKVDGMVKREQPRVPKGQFIFAPPPVLILNTPPKVLDDYTVSFILFPNHAVVAELFSRTGLNVAIRRYQLERDLRADRP